MSFFSVIIPTYNRGHLIRTAIKSLCEQTFEDWELIIVDDGSTDNTKEIVSSYTDPRINYIYQTNSERSVARNNGINHSTGEFICFLDSDDFYPTDFLSGLNETITGADFRKAMFMSGIQFQNHEGENISELIPFSKDLDPIEHLLNNKLVIPTCSICFHQSILKDFRFDERYRLWEDNHLFLRTMSKHELIPNSNSQIVMINHEDSTVAQGMSEVKLDEVDQYLSAIFDLERNQKELFSKYDLHRMLNEYACSKLQMYIYQARMNGQFEVAFEILKKGIKLDAINNLKYITVTRLKLFLSRNLKIHLP